MVLLALSEKTQGSTLQEIIKVTVVTSIERFFKGREVKTTHVLDKIFPNERRIRSLIGGLETSFGTTVWEPLAKAFAKQNGFSVNTETSLNSNVPILPDAITEFLAVEGNTKKKNPEYQHQEIIKKLKKTIVDKGITANGYSKIPKGEGVDLWLEKEGKEYLFDIKTTQINAGSGPKFSANLLNWYAYRLIENPKLDIECAIAFPFNPHAGKNFWTKEGGKVKPLIYSKEALVGDEFWDFLLGQPSTTELIFSVFESLGSEGFGDQFAPIFVGNKH